MINQKSMPIAVAFFTVNILSLLILLGAKGLVIFVNSMFSSIASFSLAALPLFIMMGDILYESNAIGIMFDAVDKWIGGIRARLHVISIIVATTFSCIGGAAMGTVAMMGSSILPEMNRRGYDKKLSAGAICAGATLDPIIPPSNLAVILAMLANVSVAKLLVSGFVPGLVLAGMIIVYVLIKVYLNPSMAPLYDISTVTLAEKIRGLLRMLPFAIIIFMVLGFIFLGIATPTEAAATGVFGSLIVAAMFKRLTRQCIRNSVFRTMKVTGMVFMIMTSAQAFSQIMALSGASQGLVELVNTMQFHPMIIFIAMNLIPLFLCCFMDQISLMLILVPIYTPIINALHFDPIWFWCIMLVNFTIGGITPPLGYVLFTLKGTTEEMTIQEIYKSVIPFVIIYVFGLVLFSLFPKMITWLPSKV